MVQLVPELKGSLYTQLVISSLHDILISTCTLVSFVGVLLGHNDLILFIVSRKCASAVIQLAFAYFPVF